jgi:hypothetical protein
MLAFVIVSLAVLASSCKKNWTCTCNNSQYTGGVKVYSTEVYIVPDATREQAAAACESYEIYSASSMQFDTCSL